MLNGVPWHPTPQHRERGCCTSPEETQRKMESTARSLLFRTRPGPPAVNKWGKVAPVLEFVLPLMLMHNLLHQCLLSLQASQRPLEQNVAADAHNDDDPIDDEMKKRVGLCCFARHPFQGCLPVLGPTKQSRQLNIFNVVLGALEVTNCLVYEARQIRRLLYERAHVGCHGRALVPGVLVPPVHRQHARWRSVPPCASVAAICELIRRILRMQAGLGEIFPPLALGHQRCNLQAALMYLPGLDLENFIALRRTSIWRREAGIS